MASNEQTLDLIAELSEIPSKYKDRNEVLQRITELGQRAMGSLACTLASVDLKSKQMKHIACASTNKEFERYMTGHEFDIGTGTWVQFDLIEKGDVVERHELQDDGQGVADPKVARKYGLTSLVGYPLHFDEELFGYINFFSNDVRQFSSAEKQLMMILARQAGIAIEKFHSQKIVAVLKDLSRRLVLKSPQDFLREVCEKVCELFSVPVCIIWRLDARTEQLAIEAASSGVDDDYRKLTLAQADKRVSNHLNRKGLSYLPNVTEARSKYVHSEAAQMRGWKSLLSAPMWAENRKFGFLDIYAREKRHYTALEKKQFQYFADHVALSFQKSELLKEAEYGKRLGKLMEIMLQIAEATNKKEVLRLLLRGSLELVEKKDGLIRLLNYQTGILEIEQLEEDEVLQTPEVGISQGITGLALSKEAPIKVDDITGAEWKDVYIKHFKNMRSELAIPILIRKASIRVGKEVKFGTKPIGVLNIESPEIGAFSEADKKCLWSLARYAAIIVETLEYDDKLAKLRKLGEKLTKIEDYGGAIKVILEAIKSILAFEYINVSVIVPERNCIKCEFIEGIPSIQKDAFKKEAVHALDSMDIQADIIKSKEIEVIEQDQRLNQTLHEKYRHDKLIQVFVPMIGSQENRVVGTVVAGYKKEYHKFIYERDVQILKNLADHIAQIVEREKSGLRVDQLTHELKSPIVGIRSHTDLLKTNGYRLRPDIAVAKFDDILADCDILLYQVGMLSHELGLRAQPSKPEYTNVFRDIIIKTLNQIVRPVMRRKDIPSAKIEYDPSDISKILVFVDKGKLNQVVYNLLTNSIKYSKRKTDDFRIRIEVEETKYTFVIKFLDWGIGVDDGYEDQIFEEGIRAPSAMQSAVTGSGFGLTVTKRIMQELGGDIKLGSKRNPTEFLLILPKRPTKVNQ